MSGEQVAPGSQYALMSDGREVAYRVLSSGDGPVIVHAPSGPWPVELLDDDPMYDRLLRILASAGRLVVYDRPGFGSSDPIDPGEGWFTQNARAYCSVLDAVEADAAWIVGSTLAAITETIRAHPDRVLGAVLINPSSRRHWQRRTDMLTDRQPWSPELAQAHTPSRANDAAFLEWLRRATRLGASKSGSVDHAAANREAVQQFVTEAQPISDGPPIMLIRRRDAMSDQEFGWWANIFPDAECVTIEGTDFGELALDAGLVAELAAAFITGKPVTAPAQRKLVAVMFTDLVDSTPAAAASGDAVWRSTLDRYEATLQRSIQRHHGTVIKHTGDGALATFPSGSEAIAAAVELRSETRELGLEGRTGIHVGEVEQRGDDIGGIAVHLTARVMGEAQAGEIIVTSTVAESSTGSTFSFTDRGIHTLKGLEHPRHLLSVVSDEH